MTMKTKTNRGAAARQNRAPVESVADFKARIALIFRGQTNASDDAELYLLRNQAPACVVRKAKTYGRNHWDK